MAHSRWSIVATVGFEGRVLSKALRAVRTAAAPLCAHEWLLRFVPRSSHGKAPPQVRTLKSQYAYSRIYGADQRYQAVPL